MKGGAVLFVNGARLVADASGALLGPDQGLAVVADLHLEKGASLARRGGALLPPYDTRATIERLERALQRLAPARVVCLGDSFHDPEAAARLGGDDAGRLRALVARHDWLWVRGNHDPAAPVGFGGRCEAVVAVGGLVLRHEPAEGAKPGEVAGHLHPKATLRARGRLLSRRCFATDGRRLLLPAFGSYAGGLNVLDPAIAGLFARGGFWSYLLGERQVHMVPHDRLEPPAQLSFDWRGRRRA
jgi:uncharacterized protein